jgi:LPS-assembly protein
VSIKTRIIPVAVGALLSVSTAWGAGPTWDCKTGPNNTWECSKDGVPDTATPAAAVTPTNQETVEPDSQVEITPAVADTPAPVQQERVTIESDSQVETTPAVTDTPAPVQPEPVKSDSQVETTPAVATTPTRERRAQPSGDTLRIDRDLDWNQCGPLTDPTENISHRSNETQITSDSAEVSRENKEARFSGNVVVTKGDQLLEADRITYNNRDNTIDASGTVYYQNPGLLLSGDSVRMDMDKNTGKIKNAQYRLPKRRGRGSASLAEILGPDQSHYENISYSTCRPGRDEWILEAEKLDIDTAEGVGTAHNAVFKFKGVPFFYLPYASFPIDDRRKSGFLVPTIGSSDTTGADLSIPYYINIAPDMDATITPRIMSKRGLMLGGEFRYLTDDYSAETRFEILPDDKEREGDENSARGAFSYNGHGYLSPRLVVNANINYVSDNDYLDDLGDSLAVSSSRYLERRGDLIYYGDHWNILARAQYYQTVDETIARTDRPYARLPQVRFSYERPDQIAGLTLHMGAEYVYFDRDETVRGQRIDFSPAVSLPLRNSWGYVTPKLGVRHTSYDLKDQLAGLSDSPDRTTSTFSLDSGVYFERIGDSVTTTLEPRMFYLYTPRENQDDIPIFDTAAYDFSFHNLFLENRFSGADRIADANQLTLALTSRTFSNDTGVESFRFSLGEIFYFDDREVQLPGVTTREDSSSATVGQIAMQLSQNWSTQADLEWDHNRSNNKTSQSAIHLRYDDDDKTLLNLGYRYARDVFEQSDISFRYPVTSQFNVVGRWDYSLRYDQTTEAFAGLEYSNCCWAFRAVGRHYINDIDADAKTAFYLQLELKGLTSLGNKVDSFLEDNLLGYTRDK